MIKLNKITEEFMIGKFETVALNHIDVHIKPCDFVAIMYPQLMESLIE